MQDAVAIRLIVAKNTNARTDDTDRGGGPPIGIRRLVEYLDERIPARALLAFSMSPAQKRIAMRAAMPRTPSRIVVAIMVRIAIAATA